jgi:hypothetical protein
LYNDSFWELVQLNRKLVKKWKDKKKETVPLLPYKEELQTIFFSLKDSNAVVYDLEDNEDNEDDNEDFTDEDDLVEESLEDPVENEEQRRAALNKLSKVKKYEISQLALQDLDVIG